MKIGIIDESMSEEVNRDIKISKRIVVNISERRVGKTGRYDKIVHRRIMIGGMKKIGNTYSNRVGGSSNG